MINLTFVSGQNFEANSFSCFIITSFQLKEKYLSFEALSVRHLSKRPAPAADGESPGTFHSTKYSGLEIPGIPCDEWNSNFPVRSINQSQAIGCQVSRENGRSNGGLFYLCLLALGLLNDSEVKVNDLLGEGDNIAFVLRI